MSVKRTFDFLFACLLLVILAVPALVAALWILFSSGRPVFYKQERIGWHCKPFWLWKFRTMRVAAGDFGVSGGDKSDRITPEGRWLCALRLDEIPNLFNILRGDMSFVGPRPPLRLYVERFPELYARVLQSRPGLTGLATLVYRKREERLLSGCRTAAETDAVYSRRCVPQKARIDLIYSRNASLCFDLQIVLMTMRSILN